MKVFIKLILLVIAATLSVYTNAETCTWNKIAGGAQHTLAIKSDGSLWAWGSNDAGQLGDNTYISKNVPVQIGNDLKWIQVGAGSGHSLGLKSDGTIWAWGANESGQLGDNSYVNKSAPVQVGTATDWISISAGLYHTIALKSDGTIWAWGYNASGQIGDGSTTGKSNPAKIGADNNWSVIAAGGMHSLALKSDGTLWSWGSNSYGQLGDASGLDKYIPVSLGSGWQTVVTSNNHNLAIKTDGTLWSWGQNSSGQLGDGSKISKLSPQQIGSNTWKSIAVSQDGSLAIKTDGTLWGWGSDQFGQIGDGSSVSKKSPVQVGTDNHWEKIIAGSYHSFAFKSDQTFWAWGLNEKGQCGDGSNTTLYVPVQITNGNCGGNDLFWIPDANLRNTLKNQYPTCFNNSDYLLIYNANNASGSVLNISGKNVSSLEGIRHFKNITTLNCSNNNLTAINELPQNIVSVCAIQNCFCPSAPARPVNVSGTWEMLPNKASCMAHSSNPYTTVTTEVNVAVPLVIGKALYFNGQSDFVDMPAFSMSETPVTIEFWAKSEIQNNAEALILNIGSADGIKVFAPNASGNIGFNYGAGNAPKYISVNDPFAWNHYAITSAGKSGICKTYINGQLIKTDTLSNTQVSLAGLRIGSGFSTTNFYKGYLHDVRIWKKIRSQSEIQNAVNSFNDYANADLIGAWKLNKGSGASAKDHSSKGFDGNINGGIWGDADNTLQYSWSPATYLSGSSGQNVSFNSSVSGTFVYNVTITKTNACTATLPVTIIVNKKAGTDFDTPIQIGSLSQGSVYSNIQNNSPSNGFKNDYGHVSDDIFYSFVLSQAANVTISHCNSGITDSYMYLFNAKRTLVASNDDYGPSCTSSYKSSITTNLAPGTYYIASEGYYTTTGDINTEVKIAPVVPAKGNTFSNPILISDNVGSCFSFNDFKNNGAGFGNDYYAQPSEDIYYKFTLTTTQTISISNCGSEIYDSYLTLLDWQGNYYASNDDASNCTISNLHSFLQLQLQPGTYYIVEEGYNNYFGYLKLNFNVVNSNCRIEEVAEAPVIKDKKLNFEVEDEVSATAILYPNPASDIVYLSIPSNSQSVPVTLKDLSGRVVKTVETSSLQTEIGISDLAEGMYYVSFTQNGKLTNLKLQVVR